MGVAGELEVDAVADGVVDDDGLVGEEYGGPRPVAVAEGGLEVGAGPLQLPLDVVDAA